MATEGSSDSIERPSATSSADAELPQSGAPQLHDDPTINDSVSPASAGNGDKAYVAPRILPKAALPSSDRPDAKVVINVPSSVRHDDEVTQAIDRSSLDLQRARNAAIIQAGRRQEPTIRIPRHQIEAARLELDAAQAAGVHARYPVDGNEQISLTTGTPASIPPSRLEEETSGRANASHMLLAALVVAGVGVLGTAAYVVIERSPSSSGSSQAANANPRAPAAAPESTAGTSKPAEVPAVTALQAVAPAPAETVASKTVPPTEVAANVNVPQAEPVRLTTDSESLKLNDKGARRPSELAKPSVARPAPARSSAPPAPQPKQSAKPYTPDSI